MFHLNCCRMLSRTPGVRVPEVKGWLMKWGFFRYFGITFHGWISSSLLILVHRALRNAPSSLWAQDYGNAVVVPTAPSEVQWRTGTHAEGTMYTVTECYVTDGQQLESRYVKVFSLFYGADIGSETQTSPYLTSTRGSFPGDKWSQCEVSKSPPTSAEVKYSGFVHSLPLTPHGLTLN
jgi:hypothetical protein